MVYIVLAVSVLEMARMLCSSLETAYRPCRPHDSPFWHLLSLFMSKPLFYPSCHAKIMIPFGERLRKEILYPVSKKTGRIVTF